jgi:hypothetical protein
MALIVASSLKLALDTYFV